MTSENKGHLSRLDRLSNSNPLYFITTSTFKRHRFLTNNDVSRILVDEWSKCLDLHGWAIGSYVIMPDHVHFFCKSATDKQNLSQMMQAWKQWTSKRIKKVLYRSLPVWNSEFFDHVLRSEESYSEKWHYVFSNPVRAAYRWEHPFRRRWALRHPARFDWSGRHRLFTELPRWKDPPLSPARD